MRLQRCGKSRTVNEYRCRRRGKGMKIYRMDKDEDAKVGMVLLKVDHLEAEASRPLASTSSASTSPHVNNPETASISR